MGGRNSQEPEKIDPVESAKAQLQAQLSTTPQAMQLSMDMANKYMEPYTRLQETTRQNVLPGESAVRSQMLQNILASLISPTGISPEQQQAMTARRGTAQDELIRTMRERANLSGGLFGGRAANAEEQAVGNLQNQFAEEDINRETTARLNAIQAALPALQILFPGINISTPQFQSAAPTGSDIYSGQINQSNTAAQLAQQQQASQNALYSALFQSLGSAASGAFSAGGILNK
jgi:hypothetical protein